MAIRKKTTKEKTKKASVAATLRSQKRRELIDAIERGEKVEDAARVMGIELRTAFRWLARYRNGGYAALQEGHRAGRPRKVDAKRMQWLYRTLTKSDPRQFQFPFFLWTSGIIRSLLKKQWNIELSKASICRLLAHMGLSPQRPIFRSYKQDRKEVERCLKQRFPQIRALARKRGAVVYFVDEAAVRVDSHRGTTWGKVGETPVVLDSGDRFGISMISAVSPRGDMKFKTFAGTMNEDRYLEFLVELYKDTGKPIIVITDKAGYHTGGLVTRCAKTSGGKVALHYLPSYSPELNPDEQVWNHSKSRIGKMYIETKEQLVAQVRNVLKSIQMSRDLILSFFQLKDTRCAALACRADADSIICQYL